MKYRTITFRSRKLKYDVLPEGDYGDDETVSLIKDEPDEEAAPEHEKEKKLSGKERRAIKKQLKKDRKEKKYLKTLDNGEIVNEREYDPEELDDLRISAILNKDGFYDALEPFDFGQSEQKERHRKDLGKNAMIIGALVLIGLGAIIYLGFTLFTMF